MVEQSIGHNVNTMYKT